MEELGSVLPRKREVHCQEKEFNFVCVAEPDRKEESMNLESNIKLIEGGK